MLAVVYQSRSLAACSIERCLTACAEHEDKDEREDMGRRVVCSLAAFAAAFWLGFAILPSAQLGFEDTVRNV